jgi:type I restriction enzyme M protein
MNKDLREKILEYSAFSDIEFNPKKSINCQARSAALFVALHQANLLDQVLESEENYLKIMAGGQTRST